MMCIQAVSRPITTLTFDDETDQDQRQLSALRATASTIQCRRPAKLRQKHGPDSHMDSYKNNAFYRTRRTSTD
jgi:soluble cytochrome b562